MPESGSRYAVPMNPRTAAFLLCLPPLPAAAMNGLIFLDPAPAADKLAVGAGLLGFSKFPGSSGLKLLPLPAFDYEGSNGLFASTDNGLGWNASRRRDIQAGLRLWPQFGRKSSDSARLSGLDEIGTRLERGAFFNYAPFDALLLQSGARYGAGRDGRGAILEAGASSGLPLPGGDLLGLTLGASWANRSWRQGYFGISEAESARSGLPAWRSGSGWQDLQLFASLEHRIDARWRFDGQVGIARLLGSAAASPVTESRRQLSLSLMLWRELR